MNAVPATDKGLDGFAASAVEVLQEFNPWINTRPCWH